MDASNHHTEESKEYSPEQRDEDSFGRFNIIGAGVVGLACALNLAQYKNNIHIFEKSHPNEWNRSNTSSVAGAEFLPLIHEHNNPFVQGQYELIEGLMPASWRMYEDLASLDPRQSGVRAVTLIEPTNELRRWPPRLEKIMKARLYTAPPVMISVDDMVIAPHQDALVFGGGEFYGEPPSDERLGVFTRRLRALASVAIGDWEPLPREVRARIGDDGFRVSERPTILSGLMIRRNPSYPWAVDVNGTGHTGITLAGGVAKKAGGIARAMLREYAHEQRKSS